MNEAQDDQIIDDIRKLLNSFTRKEPYVTNTATRILHLVKSGGVIPAVNHTEYMRGYNSGYIRGKRNRESHEPKRHSSKS